MSRIKSAFEACQAQNRAALVTFIMGGDPSLDVSRNILDALPESGADIIEVGMPFTDPAADGLTIQRAGLRALKAGMTLRRTLEMIKNFRSKNNKTPIVLMGYVNPVFSYGYEVFAKDAKAAGVDALIIVDLPPEEDLPLRIHADKVGLDIIRLVTPTTDEERLSKILEGVGGFLYYVSVTGVTGGAKASPDSLKPHLDMIRSKSKIPVVVGFGIKTPNDAQEMSKLADGVVVGSAIIEKIKDINVDTPDFEPVLGLVKSLSGALSVRDDIDSRVKSGKV